jgi:hypothetical protein
MDLQKDLSEFYNRVRELIASGRQSAYRAVNAAMVQTYWEIGRLIVEEEQQGKANLRHRRWCWSATATYLPRQQGDGT